MSYALVGFHGHYILPRFAQAVVERARRDALQLLGQERLVLP